MTSTSPNRPSIVGSDSGPSSPFPLFFKGPVVKGFQRGSRELGIPTANLPESEAEIAGKVIDSGIYYGLASLDAESTVYPMVMSFGWNPYYKNVKRTMEVHIMHKFPQDFYDREMRIIILGHIRPEQDYSGIDALLEDINFDIQVAHNCLARPAYAAYKENTFLKPSSRL
ncbi:riboflavin kinase [Synchytrium microbalum]|uniref:Riboflavin kinase n=1 Tax=Synchytrium microbalum TaxID=1806994 RepID=A0A507C1E3_9FUNG|nr:riboflavin kinase [Synchytrium microbalum]TPX35340.1 riboflavin kinase [Synchytrium microbalum]